MGNYGCCYAHPNPDGFFTCVAARGFPVGVNPTSASNSEGYTARVRFRFLLSRLAATVFGLYITPPPSIRLKKRSTSVEFLRETDVGHHW